jgi:arylformamidase
MSSRDLEKEYDTTQWSQRITDPVELLRAHDDYSNKVSDANRYAVNCLLNTPYGETFRQQLDIYGVNLPFDAPIIVYVHGGFWQRSNKHTASYAVKPFVENYAKVIVIDFDLCPNVTLSEVIKQFEKAVERIFSYAGEHNPKSVSFIGHDSGAHLITYLLSEDMISRLGDKFKLLKHVYLISGVFDVTELRNTQILNRENLLSITDENVEQLSPVKLDFAHLSKYDIEVDAYVGSDESPAILKQSREFVAHLKMQKLHANYNLMEGLDHYNIVEKLSENTYEITEKIVNYLNQA